MPMGRRILILLAMLLLPTLLEWPARGQDPPLPTPAPGEVVGSGLPPVSAAADDPPAGLAAPQDPAPAPPQDAKPIGHEPAATDATAPPKKAPAKPKAPAAKPAVAMPEPTRDEEVRRTEGAEGTPPAQPAAPAATPAAPPASAPASAAEGTGFALPADQLLMGKQEAVLSVEVQAPPDIVFNRESTAKLIIRNSGSSDAAAVIVHDELPPGLEFVSSQPDAERPAPNLLAWRISTISAGTERVILVKTRPTKRDGAVDHAATVTFQAGSKANSRILCPQLKVEVTQAPSEGKVLKNKYAEFRIVVSNPGNGPARDVIVKAILSKGLRHGGTEPTEDNSFSLPLQKLVAGQRMELDPLEVDAVQGGEQSCIVRVTSADVDFAKEAHEVERKVEVVEPKLKMTITSHDKRFTDMVAPYTITLENEGTAPARNVKLTATLGMNGKLTAPPAGGKYDPSTRKLSWVVPLIEPKEKPRQFSFEVRMGGVGDYEAYFEARGDNGLNVSDSRHTKIEGMADVDLVVKEKRRVVDVDGTTTFQILVRNYGTKEATNLNLRAALSSNVQVEETGGGPNKPAHVNPGKEGEVIFPPIERLGPGKEIALSIKVKILKPVPKIATCRVFLLHDGLEPNETLEDMAGVKVGESRRALSIGGP
ncbi:DUF11 domain-containing protein [Aquisphaera insulae]|uniref:DUF11 domain-containing protein n=1 Tax=Aquisphaera insulae TaxID=2712864 RepID=UPI0013EC8366|nr:DUF11 domain-containing protein [Aquisphaera insulae]